LTEVNYSDGTYAKYEYDALGRKIYREELNIDIDKLKQIHEQNKNQNSNSKDNNGNNKSNGNSNGNNKEKNNNGNGNGKYNNPGQGNKYGVYKDGGEQPGIAIPSSQEKTVYQYQGMTTTLQKEYSDKGSPYGEYYTANGQVISKKMFGLHGMVSPGQEESLKTTGGLMYYQYDGTNSVTALTDRHGDNIEQYRYDAFGNILTGITAPYNTTSYTGQQYDDKAGLIYMNARWYNSNVGRFMQQDTYMGDLVNPQSQNLYSYVMNNPVNMWDPTGNIPDWVGQEMYYEVMPDNSHVDFTY
jgi:RHS repeat-associated protein